MPGVSGSINKTLTSCILNQTLSLIVAFLGLSKTNYESYNGLLGKVMTYEHVYKTPFLNFLLNTRNIRPIL